MLTPWGGRFSLRERHASVATWVGRPVERGSPVEDGVGELVEGWMEDASRSGVSVVVVSEDGCRGWHRYALCLACLVCPVLS